MKLSGQKPSVKQIPVPAFGLEDRLKFYPGDIFKDPLPEADVLIMAHILHDWNLEKKLALIEKAYQAIPSSPRLAARAAGRGRPRGSGAATRFLLIHKRRPAARAARCVRETRVLQGRAAVTSRVGRYP